MLTDFDFNLSVVSNVSEMFQFNGLYDICYASSQLYICDYFNKRIQVYSKDTDFVKSFTVEYNPLKIKSTNFTIYVEGLEPDEIGIYFYNSNDFHLIRNYNPLNGRISQINSMFYEFNYKTQTMSCYDENANLKEIITLEGLDKFLTDTWDGEFIYHNQALFIQSWSQK